MIGINSRIVIAGAGSIGCYVGGRLASAGKAVTLLVRPRMIEGLQQNGLRITDPDGSEKLVEPGQFFLTSDPEIAFRQADIILVTVKSGATEEMAKSIRENASSDIVVVSLQNGVGNAETLRQHLHPEATVISGMVPFNVVQSEPSVTPLSVRRTMPGTILIDNTLDGLADVLSVPGLSVQAHPDMLGILWGKLLTNLNNALNALSNLPLVEQLADRSWRLLVADQLSEGLKVVRAHGITPAKVQGAPPAVLPSILRLPNLLFRIVAARMLAINPHARSSMWEDLSRGRATEIDYLQGVIIRMADEKNIAVPLTRKISACVKKVEGKPLRSHSVEDIRG
ncbi:2-dehydropantoate 2-reductase [Phyllobacterium sp. 1468]|uniref:2-dehydropantoate 2-reductase n=1 Tax=Phyllobacterium sp. 1468 TaxID=2817759 RepID=UPI00285DF235|nr:2-dehydropantoate 2-reductase [Phyllobacterium sp. 1468]MDR6633136.1 2-dehydropantoate 2-reductase [Phyllobacterium sp. 1468]